VDRLPRLRPAGAEAARGRIEGARVRERARRPRQAREVPLTSGGAGALTTVTRADGIVVVPKELEGLEEGTEVDVELLD
jgi:molybdopterin biosynthesis enzyme